MCHTGTHTQVECVCVCFGLGAKVDFLFESYGACLASHPNRSKGTTISPSYVMCAFGWLGMKAFQEKFERRKAHPLEATSSFPMSLLAKETGCHSLPVLSCHSYPYQMANLTYMTSLHPERHHRMEQARKGLIFGILMNDDSGYHHSITGLSYASLGSRLLLFD